MGSRKTGDGVENWDEFVRRAQVYIDTGRLDSEEIRYKSGRTRSMR